jgi:hypothetical protein
VTLAEHCRRGMLDVGRPSRQVTPVPAPGTPKRFRTKRLLGIGPFDNLQQSLVQARELDE